MRLAAPVPRPPKVLCLGLNYRDHAEEAGQPIPEVPIIFSKQPIVQHIERAAGFQIPTSQERAASA